MNAIFWSFVHSAVLNRCDFATLTGALCPYGHTHCVLDHALPAATFRRYNGGRECHRLYNAKLTGALGLKLWSQLDELFLHRAFPAAPFGCYPGRECHRLITRE